jgi:outer membrane receptor protein involved in Fe transport
MKARLFQWARIAGLLIAATAMVGQLAAQTTGKIAGRVSDEKSGQPLPGANVIIEGTTIGTASDQNGDFFIINLSPQTYTLKITMIGYKPVIIKDVRVSVNRTEYLDIKMQTMVIEGEAVVVTAPKITIRKDQTSTVKNVSADEMEILPVENVNQIVSMQAGVVKGHFRGGRNTEVSYMIDGIPVDEAFGGAGRSVDLEVGAVQDLEVITGTFNAEYGDAMSGIVNAITREGGNDLHASVSAAWGNYYTSHDKIFIGLKPSEINRNQDYKFNLSGPILSDRLNFVLDYRYQNNKNHLNGYRLFRVDDFSYYSSDDPAQWYAEFNGDSAYVPMNRSQNSALMGKLSTKLFKKIKLSALYTLNQDEWHSYSHEYKYNPDGMPTAYRNSNMVALTWNHMLSNKLFYEVKGSYINNYYGNYIYKDPTDTHYVHDAYSQSDGPGFFTGGQSKNHTRRTQIDHNLKFDLTYQLNKRHSLKTGIQYTQHHIDSKEHQIRNFYAGMAEEGEWQIEMINGKSKVRFLNYIPVVLDDTTIYSDIINVKPREFAAYLQDKMEFDQMVINLGIRYDYFYPDKKYPTNWRNPANQIRFPDNPEKMSQYISAKPKTQLSPRFGLSYQLGSTAVLHFSYGHFFQMPPYYALYSNNSYRISPTDYETLMGNPTIKPQKTITYEIGLWQELMTGMELEVALYYRDIYDLLSTKIISTYNQTEYGLYTNKDYGNARGLEVKYRWHYQNVLATLNYTLQYTRGNADYPTQTFDRAGNSIDPVITMIPMSWDQRHTLNATIGYNTFKYGITLTGYYESGTPFTWSPVSYSILYRINLLPNNSWQPAQYNFDLSAYYNFNLFKNLRARLTVNVYNLFDRLNEVWVNGQTGRAYTAIIRETDLLSHRSLFNTYEDRIHNPSAYAAPRLVKIGLGFDI